MFLYNYIPDVESNGHFFDLKKIKACQEITFWLDGNTVSTHLFVVLIIHKLYVPCYKLPSLQP